MSRTNSFKGIEERERERGEERGRENRTKEMSE
jgi:hypothetical protein